MDNVEQELLDTVSSVLTKFGDILVYAIKEQLIARRNIATGTLVNSIVFQITYNGTVANLEISAEDYFKYVEAGRTPGSKAPPVFDIVKWLETRRLDVLGTDFSRTGI